VAKRPSLAPDIIVSTAIELLNNGGHKTFSMRKLAAQFGVDPMAIYYHIPNRAALMYRVVDTVVSQCELPEDLSSWQDASRETCRAFRRLAHRNPGVIQVFDEFDDWIPSEHRIAEALHVALLSAGFDARMTVRGARLLLAFTENFCSWELTDWIEPYTPEMRSELTDSLAQGDFPVTTQLLDEIVDVDPDIEFEFGLEIIIQGLESHRTYRCDD
jgi:AcrR family transcriptional regulator